MNNSKLLFGQIMSNRIKADKWINWRLVKSVKAEPKRVEPEELFYYHDNGVYCCTIDLSTWSANGDLPKVNFKIEYN